MKLASGLLIVNWGPLSIIYMSEPEWSTITLYCSAQHNIPARAGIQVKSYTFSYATHPSRFFFLTHVIENIH